MKESNEVKDGSAGDVVDTTPVLIAAVSNSSSFRGPIYRTLGTTLGAAQNVPLTSPIVLDQVTVCSRSISSRCNLRDA